MSWSPSPTARRSSISARGVARIIPEAGIVGEEAVSADPSLLDDLGNGLKWLIDPIDGTGNFASGKPPFGLMIALIDNGIVQASWMLDPLTDRLCCAALGGGATINGERRGRRPTGAPLPVAGISLLFADPEARVRLKERARRTARRWRTSRAAPPSNIRASCWA